MKTRISLLVLFVISLAACSPTFETAAPTSLPVATEAVSPTPTIEAAPALSYSPISYEDTAGKFGFQYPADWTLEPEQVIGDRGSQMVLLSPGSTIETLAEGGSRIVLLRYSWDPKNDLSAWSAQRKLAWEASGLVILDESTRELADGRAVVDLLMKGTDGTEILFSLTTIGDRYLEINAQGNLELCREILGTLKSLE